MKCKQFEKVYDDWINRHQVFPLPEKAQNHQASCAGCALYASNILHIDSLLRAPREPIPVPDLSHIRDRIVAAHRPREISLPPSTSLRTAALLTLPALCVWGVSLFVPSGTSALLQLIVVFLASLLLMKKLL